MVGVADRVNPLACTTLRHMDKNIKGANRFDKHGSKGVHPTYGMVQTYDILTRAVFFVFFAARPDGVGVPSR